MAVLLFRNIFGAQISILLCFSSLATGLNATAPRSDDQLVRWQPGDKNRGTWAIISNCLSTIFAGTWSIQHLNVPATSDGNWPRTLRSCKWMLVNILFPEFIVLQALFELLMAMKALNHMADNEKAVAYPWWYHRHLSLSTLVQEISGLRRRLCGLVSSSNPHDGQDSESQEAKEAKKPEEFCKWTLTQCFFANMGGIFYYENESSHFPLTALQIAAEQKKSKGRFDHPEKSEEDIEDKSKRDWFAKLIAALQFLQLALSLIVRKTQGLAFSQLEAVTLGFAVCGTITYLIYLYKPQNVGTPFKVGRGLADGGPIQYEKTFDSFWEVLTNTAIKKEADTADIKLVFDRVKNDNIPIVPNSSFHPAVFFLALASGLFGAIHVIAWNFEFPTAAEKLCWRIATGFAIGSPMAGLITIPFAQWTMSSGDSQGFMVDCLRLLREYSWHTRDKDKVDKAYDRLEQIYKNSKTDDDDVKIFYKDIFPPRLRNTLLNFITVNEEFRMTLLVDLHPNFFERFRSLCDLMEDKGAKKLCETAKTNVFPRRNLLPKAYNLSVLSLTSTLYCLARLLLLAISISSLRRMPKSVYLNTPWTRYIPSLGSMS